MYGTDRVLKSETTNGTENDEYVNVLTADIVRASATPAHGPVLFPE